MLNRIAFKETVTDTDIELHAHPGKGTTDWDLLAVLVSRENTESIALAVTLIDGAGDEYIVGAFDTWEGLDLVFTESMPIRLDPNVEVKVITTGVTTGFVNVRIITKLATLDNG